MTVLNLVQRTLLILLATAAFSSCGLEKSPEEWAAENLKNTEESILGLRSVNTSPLEIRSAYFSFHEVEGGLGQAQDFVDALRGSAINAVTIDIKEVGLHFDAYSTRRVHPQWNNAMEEWLRRSVSSKASGQAGELKRIVELFKSRGYYVILRQVVFNDPVLARIAPETAIRTTRGDLWGKTSGGQVKPWVSPYNPKVRLFNIEVALRALRAVDAMADEIQFDYIRFPDPWVHTNGYKDINFSPYQDSNRRRCNEIADFLREANSTIKGHFPGTRVGIDVFGYVANGSNICTGIGQEINKMAKHVDAIYPMQYPSHWACKGCKNFGTNNPETIPQRIYRETTRNLRRQLDPADRNRVAIIPWIQAFVLKSFQGVKMQEPLSGSEIGPYSAKQIEGIIEGGGDGFAIWSASRSWQLESISAVR